MDSSSSWASSAYAPQEPPLRQARYGSHSSAVLSPTSSQQLPREYPPQSSQQQPQSNPPAQHQQQQEYQAYHVGQQQTATTPSRLDAAATDYMDVDSASPYASHSAARKTRYLDPEEPVVQRYSPNAAAAQSQSSQYAPPTAATYHNPPQMPFAQVSQHRQSPTRPNYTTASQSYYASGSSPRISAPSSSSQQSYQQHPLQSPQQPPPQSSARLNPLTLEPPNLNDVDLNGGRFYPQSATIPQQPSMFDQPSPARPSPAAREPAPRLQRLTNIADLRPRKNTQPAFRRANPEGGFISPVQALTTYLPSTYRICNPAFKYESSRNPRRVLTKPSKGVKNDGYDNEDSDYILYVNDILGSEETKNRYLILDVLGQGTFGQVVKCQNLKTQEVVAVKVVKNRTAYFNQSMMEVSVLELLNSKLDKKDEHHILRLKDTFIHRQHLCLVFELLSVNLYELIKQNQFRGLSTTLVRVFAQQLLNALCLLNKARLIHCDLKPENILLKNLESPIIKVIDFGSACDERQTVYTYIQSRFYRSPEVLLGLPYSSAIDMWSLGCIVVELFLGLPLFPGSSEYNQVNRITEMLGMPPTWMIEMGKQAGDFYEKVTDEFGRKSYRLKTMEQYSREHGTKELPGKKYFQATKLHDIIHQYAMPRKNMKPVEIDRENNNRIAFIDFVRGLLNLNPMERWSPQQAKNHPFITQQRYTGPFVPAMNLKDPNPMQKPAMTSMEARQAEEAAARQQQQHQQQQAAQKAQQLAAQQAVHAQSQYSPGGPIYSNPPSAGVYVNNNVYSPPSHIPSHQAQHPPYPSGQSYHAGSGQYQDHSQKYRPRAGTMGVGGIPPTLQLYASKLKGANPIPPQPSPAFIPPEHRRAKMNEGGEPPEFLQRLEQGQWQ